MKRIETASRSLKLGVALAFSLLVLPLFVSHWSSNEVYAQENVQVSANQLKQLFSAPVSKNSKDSKSEIVTAADGQKYYNQNMEIKSSQWSYNLSTKEFVNLFAQSDNGAPLGIYFQKNQIKLAASGKPLKNDLPVVGLSLSGNFIATLRTGYEQGNGNFGMGGGNRIANGAAGQSGYGSRTTINERTTQGSLGSKSGNSSGPNRSTKTETTRTTTSSSGSSINGNNPGNGVNSGSDVEAAKDFLMHQGEVSSSESGSKSSSSQSSPSSQVRNLNNLRKANQAQGLLAKKRPPQILTRHRDLLDRSPEIPPVQAVQRK